ncbi:MAG: hypothetical protein WBN40_12895 [Pseudomonadales bacterium]
MHAALEIEDTVQHYIEAMLFDASAEPVMPAQAVQPERPEHKQQERKKQEQKQKPVPPRSAHKQAAESAQRGAAFVRHLEVAQARTADRLADHRRQRPAALAKAPAWVQSEQLRCLVFKVANLHLALPTQYLAGVTPFVPEQLCEPGAVELEQWQRAFADICMGSVDGDLLLDTARLVMPERYQPAMRDEYRQMVRISDMCWRFAVDGIGSEMVFNAGDVRWRSQHTRREWLAGTVIDQMCAIVDVDALHRNLLAASVLDEPRQ